MKNSNQNGEGRTPGPLSSFFFLTWTFILIARPQDYFSFLMPLRPVLSIMVLTFAAMLLEGSRFREGFTRIREVRLVLLLFAIMVVGIPFSVHKRLAFDFVFTEFPNTLAYFLVFIIQVRSFRRLDAAVWVAVIAVLFSSVNYLRDTLVAGVVSFRLAASQMYDANDIASVFATFLPLSIYLLLSGRSKIIRLAALAAAISMALGIVISQSRGGLLALGCNFIALLFLKTRQWAGGRKTFVLVLLLATIMSFLPVAVGRLQNLGEDYNLWAEGGRLHIWKQNLQILAARPLFGVGANCSFVALGLFRAQERGLKAWQPPHSSLIQVGVETGVPGLVVFLLLNIGAISTVRRLRNKWDENKSLLPFFLPICFYGFWASNLFLTHGYSINLYFLLGMAGVLRRMSENVEYDGEAEKEPQAAYTYISKNAG